MPSKKYKSLFGADASAPLVLFAQFLQNSFAPNLSPKRKVVTIVVVVVAVVTGRERGRGPSWVLVANDVAHHFTHVVFKI